jgi:hypothetical protein
MTPVLKFATLFAAITTATTTALTPAFAEPLPLDITFLSEGDDIGVYKELDINIPVNNTTQPVYGGVVRYYDVAIAQAVAITYESCTNRNEKGADLQLTAGKQGQIKMGRFYISCELAYDLVSAYGMSDEVARPVKSWGGQYWKDVRSLNLNTDAKAQRFVNFSSNFKREHVRFARGKQGRDEDGKFVSGHCPLT